MRDCNSLQCFGDFHRQEDLLVNQWLCCLAWGRWSVRSSLSSAFFYCLICSSTKTKKRGWRQRRLQFEYRRKPDTEYHIFYTTASCDDDCGHSISHEDSNGHANLKKRKPHGLLVLAILIDPDRIVHQQKDLADSSCKSAQIGCYFMRTENEQREWNFQQDESDDC